MATIIKGITAAGKVVPIAVDDDGHVRVDTGGGAASPTMKHVVVAYTASQTGATVLDPTTGKSAVIVGITVSASAAGTVYLFDNADAADTKLTPILSLAANGGANCDPPMALQLTADNIVKYTSGAGAAGSIIVHYYEV